MNEELGWEREREREGGGGGGATVQFLFICARPRVCTQYLCMQMALSEDTQQRKVENRKKYKLGKLLRDDQFRVETNCSNIREYSNIAQPNEYFPWFEL